jgi:hypothetical protein
MAELFGIDIAGIVADVIGPGLLDVTITKYTRAARDDDNLTGGIAKTPAPYVGAKGIWEELPKTPPPGIEFELTDRIALLIGDTIPAGALPERNDLIQIDGIEQAVVQLLAVDPANAAYRFLCRDRSGPDGE